MKLQIDTRENTIKVEGSVNLNELYEALRKLLPEGEWKSFVLISNATIEWVNPITIPTYPIFPAIPYYRPNPWTESPIITYCGTTNTMPQYKLNEGIYSIEI